MRALLGFVIVAFAAWSGWWWYATDTAEKGAHDAFAQARASGWQASHQGISTAGYPNRVDLTITQPDVVTPNGNWGYNAPFVQLFALTYKPWHLIAAFPNTQNLLTPMGEVQISSTKLQSSVVFEPNLELPLNRSQLAGENVALTTSIGAVSAQTLGLATRVADAAGLTQDIALDLGGITLPAVLQSRLPAEIYPEAAARLRLEAKVELDRRIDRAALERQPKMEALDLTNLTLSWGPTQISLSGKVTPDSRGYAQGNLEVSLTGGLQALQAAETAGLIRANEARQYSALLAMMGGVNKPLNLPLTLKEGRMSLGPLPLGAAPRLRH